MIRAAAFPLFSMRPGDERLSASTHFDVVDDSTALRPLGPMTIPAGRGGLAPTPRKGGASR